MNSKSKKVDKTVNQNNRNGYCFTSFSKVSSSKKELKELKDNTPDNTPKLPKSRPVSKSVTN